MWLQKHMTLKRTKLLKQPNIQFVIRIAFLFETHVNVLEELCKYKM